MTATQPRSLLREAFSQRPKNEGAHRGPHRSDVPAQGRTSSPAIKLVQRSGGKDGRQLCAALPIAAEIQAILKGHIQQGLEPVSHIFGCSPPPRDCTNALVRDSSFSSMRLARPAGNASSCSTAWHLANGSRHDSCGMMACMSPSTSAFSTA